MRPTEACALPEGASDPCDRLSALPEGVLHAILSFLPARQAVQTSVLARSWRFLWRGVPCVAIDAREFGVGASRRDQPNWSRFERFATNLLSRRCGSLSLDSFRLFAHGHDAPVDDWIRRAIDCSPSVLEIATPFRASSPAPPPSIVFPRLGSSPFYYRRLKRLRLEEVELDDTFTDLLRTCPALVDLELVSCDNCFWQLESDTLERMVITSCYDCFDPGRPTVITAPSLASLELGIQQDSFVYGVSVCDFACLVRASIYIGCGAYFPERRRRRLLRSLFNVTSLQLTGFETLGMLHQNSKKFPAFPNLRNLSLESCFLDYGGCDVQSNLEDLGRFLQNAPRLEKLTLQKCTWEEEWKSITLQRQAEKTFTCPKLKLIEFMYDDDEDGLPVQFLLCIARTLPDARILVTKI